MRRRNSSLGFTLLEMLAAMAMAGAVMAPLYIITRGIAEQTSSKQMEVEAMQRARIAMDTLIRDFSRAGLFTSPNTSVDNRSLNNQTSGNAQFRAAVIHLNPGGTGPDAVMLSGNFLGSDAYRALAISESQLRIIGTMGNREDCERQFSPAFAFAHISDNSGRELDARVTDAIWTDKICQVTIDSRDYHTQSFKSGDTILLSANQTIVYAVEDGTLVRYFVDYDSNSLSNGCSIDAAVTSAANIKVPGTVLVNTRQVVANFVQDFQVWFRPVTSSNGWVVPHYQSWDTVNNESGEGKFFEDGFTPADDKVIIPLSTTDTISDDSVTCGSFEHSGSLIGPEQVRSALIRLTVRSEKSETALLISKDDEPTRLEKHLLAADKSMPLASGEAWFPYVLRTVTTEVEMPNLTARSDLLPLL
jgi:prepilin-type N-terminal cleavage/methylation domain-containing protein